MTTWHTGCDPLAESDPVARAGVVVLANAAMAASTEASGFASAAMKGSEMAAGAAAQAQKTVGEATVAIPWMRLDPATGRILLLQETRGAWLKRPYVWGNPSQNALILELKSYPISPVLLRLFLSRFFFKDKTPHFVILVKDWMGLSTEIDSFRTGIDDPDPRPIKKRRGDSILSKLPRK